MPEIQASVGRDGVNDPSDVLLVQQQLNRVRPALNAIAALVEDGLIGEKTIGAILAFQSQIVGMKTPDGRIDPGGRTWKSLIGYGVPAAPTLPASIPPVIDTTNRPANVIAFLEQTLTAAQQVRATWGVPVSICLAQAALESGWGQSVKGNAYFGIKGKSLTGQSTDFTTHEFVDGEKITIQDSFRAYQDFAESADDYGRFLRSKPRYEECFEHSNDPLAFADSLQAAGYATDPSYADKVKRLIQRYGLAEYDA
jgi:peptidoglycan hydrolase-like protein with peptidoglycan-binding domain